GILLGVIYIKNSNIWYPILVHIFYNTFAILIHVFFN
ncbi:CPBP family intramembrane metalloprotease, partial [Enterococcus faecalis]|nr:CPBP family intramembrane metalloprotease [Enterococcus faecalis]